MTHFNSQFDHLSSKAPGQSAHGLRPAFIFCRLEFWVGAALAWTALAAPLRGQAAKPTANPQVVSGSVTTPLPAAAQAMQQGYALLNNNDARGAEAAFRRAVDAQPELADAHRGLALALWKQGKGGAAVQEMTTVTQLTPQDASAHIELARMAWNLAGPVPSQAGTPSAPDLNSADFLHVAIREMLAAVKMKPNAADLRTDLAELYMESRQPKLAEPQAEAAIKLEPGNAQVVLTLGQVLLSMGEEDRAAVQFQKAAQIDPHSGLGYLGLGQLREYQHNLPEAEKNFRLAIAAQPGLEAAYAELGRVLELQGRTADAQKTLEKVAQMNPQDWQSSFRLARMLTASGDPARASQLLNQVLATHPDYLPARELQAQNMLRRGDTKGALEQAQAILKLKPQAPEGHRVMALALWKQRDFDGSLEEIAQALAADPNSAQMMALQSIDLWQQKRRKEADLALLQAAKLEPNISSAEVFCRLILCGGGDIARVDDFLRGTRWVLAPKPDF
jgi:tetratricopeptide (TPR) repeat protein